jgi:hypothetical protein
MEATHVEDSESLYRAIRARSNEYKEIDGIIVFSSTAFDDRLFKPSVDRSQIRTDPVGAKKSISDGVTKVTAAEVRGTCRIPIIKDGKETGQFHIADAYHRPIKDRPPEPDNPAHCQIECAPSVANKSRFRRLKEALARLATTHGFVVPPSSGS